MNCPDVYAALTARRATESGPASGDDLTVWGPSPLWPFYSDFISHELMAEFRQLLSERCCPPGDGVGK